MKRLNRAIEFEPVKAQLNHLISLKLKLPTVCLLHVPISYFIISAIKFFVSSYRINSYKKLISATELYTLLYFWKVK